MRHGPILSVPAGGISTLLALEGLAGADVMARTHSVGAGRQDQQRWKAALRVLT